MAQKVFVVGVGMTKFERPGSTGRDYPGMVGEAVAGALDDCGLTYLDVDQAVAAYVYGESTAGQRALYGCGLTGIPIYNVNNNCASGSSALFLAKQLVEGASANCVLAVGFEKMIVKGQSPPAYPDRARTLGVHLDVMRTTRGVQEASVTAQFFGNAGLEHMQRYGTTIEQIAGIAVKNHRHSLGNHRAQFQTEYSLQEVLDAPMVYSPLTRLQCCPTSDGAAAAVVCSEDFVERHALEHLAVEIVAMDMGTDRDGVFSSGSAIDLIGFGMAHHTALRVYDKAGLGPEDVDVIELHDCFSANELVTYEALELCGVGAAGTLVDSGEVTYGGKWVVNPSGGLISKGHPLGATGLAQCAELCWQLRGDAGSRQVAGASIGMQHNLGLGGAVVVGIYRGPEIADGGAR